MWELAFHPILPWDTLALAKTISLFDKLVEFFEKGLPRVQYAFKNKAGISRPVSTFEAVRGFSGRVTKYSEVIGGS